MDGSSIAVCWLGACWTGLTGLLLRLANDYPANDEQECGHCLHHRVPLGLLAREEDAKRHEYTCGCHHQYRVPHCIWRCLCLHVLQHILQRVVGWYATSQAVQLP